MPIVDPARIAAASVACVSLINSPCAASQNLAWIEPIATPQADVAVALVSDEIGGAYICGETRGALVGGMLGGAPNLWITRHNRHGQRLWARQIGGTHRTTMVAAVPDTLGGLIVAGATAASLANSNSGGLDAFVRRYLPSGDPLGTWQFGTAQDERVTALGSDGSTGLYVAGTTTVAGTSTQLDVWIFKLELFVTGVTWQRSLGVAEFTEIIGILPDDDDGLFIVGVPSAAGTPLLVRRFDEAGNRIWTLPLPSGVTVRDTESDGAGGLYLVGEVALAPGSAGGEADAWIARYDGIGAELWSATFGSTANDSINAIAVDGGDVVLLAGKTDGRIDNQSIPATSEDAWVARFDASGDEVWIRQLGSGNSDDAVAVAPDGSEGAYVAGGTLGDLGGPPVGLADAWIARFDPGLVFHRFCTAAVINSTGSPGRMHATGNNQVGQNDLTLVARQLPLGAFGIFLASQTQGFAPWAGGSQGHLCLAGSIGRFALPGQILSAGTTGSFSLVVDLTAIPSSSAFVAVVGGERWHFQTWHRDANPMVTSNFTEAVSITFH